MMKTVRAATAALALAAFVAQPVTAEAGGGKWFVPLWIATSAVCTAAVIASMEPGYQVNNGRVIGRYNGRVLVCLIPFAGPLALLLNHAARNR
jgi:hypothetical protein